MDPILKDKLLSGYERVVAKCMRYRPGVSETLVRSQVARAIHASIRSGEVETDQIERDALWRTVGSDP